MRLFMTPHPTDTSAMNASSSGSEANNSPTIGNAPPAGPSKLYSEWLAWVQANLGRHPGRSARSASAALEAIQSGGGYHAAVRAAESSWILPLPVSPEGLGYTFAEARSIQRYAEVSLLFAVLALIFGPGLWVVGIAPIYLDLALAIPVIALAVVAFILGVITRVRIRRLWIRQGYISAGPALGKGRALAAMIIGVVLVMMYATVITVVMNAPPVPCYIPDFGMVC